MIFQLRNCFEQTYAHGFTDLIRRIGPALLFDIFLRTQFDNC